MKILEIEELRPEPTEAPPYSESQESQPKVVRKPIQFTQLLYNKCQLETYKSMKNLDGILQIYQIQKHLKAVNSYSKHSAFIKQILNSRAIQNRIIPQDWKDGKSNIRTWSWLQQRSWWREEAREKEQKNRARGIYQ